MLMHFIFITFWFLCKLGSVCNSRKCVKIGSVTTEGTTVNTPWSCSTRLWHNNNQLTKIPGVEKTTSLGVEYILGENTTIKYLMNG